MRQWTLNALPLLRRVDNGKEIIFTFMSANGLNPLLQYAMEDFGFLLSATGDWRIYGSIQKQGRLRYARNRCLDWDM